LRYSSTKIITPNKVNTIPITNGNPKNKGSSKIANPNFELPDQASILVAYITPAIIIPSVTNNPLKNIIPPIKIPIESLR